MPLPHIELAGVDSYRIVHDAVEDGVGDGVAAETTASFLGRQLGGERGAGDNARILAHFRIPALT